MRTTRKFTDELDVRFLRADDPALGNVRHPRRIYGAMLSRMTWEVEYTGQAVPPGLEWNNPDWVSIPVGFVTDGVTIPQVLWWFLPSWGHPIVRAAVLHDYLIQLFRSEVGPHPAYPTRRSIDGVFYEAARSLGINRFVAGTAWTVIRLASRWKGEG